MADRGQEEGGELRVAILQAPPVGSPGVHITDKRRVDYIRILREVCHEARAKTLMVAPDKSAGTIMEQVEGFSSTAFILPNCPEGMQILPMLNREIGVGIVEIPGIVQGEMKYPVRAQVFSLESEHFSQSLLSWLGSSE